jgi:leucyl/phenylalanyl-tRNA--protein transferase
MPIFMLNDTLVFPDPNLAVEDGLLAIEGDLSTERLLLAYSNGIFPWYSEGDPIMWWSPDPRMILYPDKFKIAKSFRQTLNNKNYEIKFDHRFEAVIEQCSKVPRPGQDGTWITNDMMEAYIRLHKEGFAHSVETYFEGRLVGGLYGISLGKAFFGESMFFTERDASKLALYYLVQKVREWEFVFIDAQVETSHLMSMGAENISRKDYLEQLKEALKYPTIKGKW